jgi:predicted ABC-type ATPase
VPTLTVIAGPNGSGKSTLTRTVEFDGRDRLLDPDAIARRMNPFDPSAAAIAAGREVLERTEDYLGQGVKFCGRDHTFQPKPGGTDPHRQIPRV